MEELGALGFWLGMGIFLAGSVIASALKERDKEREKQATLRALLTEKATPEVLEYLREKDAAELKLQRQVSGLDWGGGQPAGWVAATIGVLAIVAGLLSLIYTSPRREFVNSEWVTTAAPGLDFPLAPVAVMLGIWAAGFVIAALVWMIFRKKKNDAKPGA